jgi:xanthine dehydrogenase molybdopterin-binding subunit B
MKTIVTIIMLAFAMSVSAADAPKKATDKKAAVKKEKCVPSKDVVCQVKRMGGGFGGKESQAAPFAAMAALCAQKLNCPVRLCLTKDDDMIMTGKRNPFENLYQWPY